MVRKNPLHERGPAPKGGRPPFEGVERKRFNTPKTLFELRPEEEYFKLWRHALIGTSTVIGLLEAYRRLGVPDEGIQDTIKSFINRLTKILDKETPNVSEDSSTSTLPE